ncbi:GNAT family N-acetyltransferase [Brevundimonas bacteroides]|uniref:GNAT family N-acetyltransferase n=1 Tax=Brevundimonas bacteroides TaxID=74311 RepID=UPI0004975688|nr:GNAT family N-acetyltransferase [Brevundimonas bacteroides]
MIDRPIQIRALRTDDWPVVHPLIAELRSLSEAEFLEAMTRQTQHGYQMVGAWSVDRWVGVVGYRPVRTLARGLHLHVDDLVVDPGVRASGIGRALLAHVEGEARLAGAKSIFLDARPESIGFYEREGFVPHTSPSMVKRML